MLLAPNAAAERWEKKRFSAVLAVIVILQLCDTVMWFESIGSNTKPCIQQVPM